MCGGNGILYAFSYRISIIFSKQFHILTSVNCSFPEIDPSRTVYESVNFILIYFCFIYLLFF